jgi:DNA-binding transcriptional regulator LsrR (DeoR family)
MWNERSVQRILELQAKMTMAIFGVGSVDADHPNHVYAGDYLDESDLNILATSDVVGDVATVFPRRRILRATDVILNEATARHFINSCLPDLDPLRGKGRP